MKKPKFPCSHCGKKAAVYFLAWVVKKNVSKAVDSKFACKAHKKETLKKLKKQYPKSLIDVIAVCY